MTEEKPIRDRDELHQLSQYLLGYARYDLDEGASDSSRYLLDDLEMCLHHVREGNFTNHAEGIDVYTECPNCVGGIVGPRGCMDCNDPTGEYARADEQAEQLKDMKNW